MRFSAQPSPDIRQASIVAAADGCVSAASHHHLCEIFECSPSHVDDVLETRPNGTNHNLILASFEPFECFVRELV